MYELPQTRNSLLLRIQDAEDAEAWDEFLSIYRPAVYGLARRKGLQDADAQDLTQTVFVAVSSAIKQWIPKPGRGRFRSWLLCVVRNALIDELRRNRPDAGQGGTSVWRHLDACPETPTIDEQEVEWEVRRQVFRWAARQIRIEFEQATWIAFWRTTVEGRPMAEVASSLNKKVGAIYTARTRVLRRLKEKIREYEYE